MCLLLVPQDFVHRLLDALSNSQVYAEPSNAADDELPTSRDAFTSYWLCARRDHHIKLNEELFKNSKNFREPNVTKIKFTTLRDIV